MQDNFRLYRRPNGMFYAEEYQTRHRESLQTKDEAEARRLIAAKNQAATQPVFNLEMAKVYLKAHDPQFCERTWSLVSDAVQHTYEGPTKARWEKFIRSEPMQGILEKQLIQTTSCHFLAVLNHPGAGVIEQNLSTFAPSVKAFLQANDLDGFDIDYEEPTFTSNASFQAVSQAIRAALICLMLCKLRVKT